MHLYRKMLALFCIPLPALDPQSSDFLLKDMRPRRHENYVSGKGAEGSGERGMSGDFVLSGFPLLSCPPRSAALGRWPTIAHGKLSNWVRLPKPQHPDCHEPGRHLQPGGPEAPDLPAHGQWQCRLDPGPSLQLESSTYRLPPAPSSMSLPASVLSLMTFHSLFPTQRQSICN